jgi:hypothetical protein
VGGQIDWDSREDDEVCAEMRKLQKELKDQVTINVNRKTKLLKVVEGQLQYEQYKHILDGLDGQVEHSFLKRYVRILLQARYNLPKIYVTLIVIESH